MSFRRAVPSNSCSRSVRCPRSGRTMCSSKSRRRLNRADILQRLGNYPSPPGAPANPGLEASGTVAAVGEQVKEFKIGDAVCALLQGGGYSEYCAVHEGQVLPIPRGLDLIQGAALAGNVLHRVEQRVRVREIAARRIVSRAWRDERYRCDSDSTRDRFGSSGVRDGGFGRKMQVLRIDSARAARSTTRHTISLRRYSRRRTSEASTSFSTWLAAPICPAISNHSLWAAAWPLLPHKAVSKARPICCA